MNLLAPLTGLMMSAADPGAPVWRVLFENPVIALFAIIGFGLAIGNFKIAGVSLGTSGVMFAALVFGAFGVGFPSQIGTVGLALFAYCVGLTAGPGFFRSLFHHGAGLAKLALLITGTGAGLTAGLAYLLGIRADLAAGVFAGALTSTPGLAAATDLLGKSSDVSIGYGIAYPFGIAGVVLFVQVLPRMLRIDLSHWAQQRENAAPQPEIVRQLVEVQNGAVAGKRLQDIVFFRGSRSQVSRVMQGERLVPVAPETRLEVGMHVLVVGEACCMEHVAEYLGRKSDRPYFWDTESERMQVVVTAPAVVGKSFREINPLSTYGVTVSRITRNDVEFVPTLETVVQPGDVLHAVGEADRVRQFAAKAGHRARSLDETDLISLAVGLTVGAIIGMMPFALPGTKGFTLGLAGGPLFVGLVLGHFGRIGQVRGHLPRAARYLLTEIGLAFFLASAGVRAGERLIPVLRTEGIELLLMGAVVTVVPMLVGYAFARRVLRIDPLSALGGACGSMTSTPGLGALTDRIDSNVPVVSYATAYPVALIMMTVFVQVIAALLA